MSVIKSKTDALETDLRLRELAAELANAEREEILRLDHEEAERRRAEPTARPAARSCSRNHRELIAAGIEICPECGWDYNA